MNRLLRALSASCAAAALCVGTLLLAPVAGAHVHVAADNPTPGAYAVLTFQVPGESDTGAVTTRLTVQLPDVTSARTELMPGWTATLDRDVRAGTVRSVTWTAAPGVGISPDQFARFSVSVKLPTRDELSLPATQYYSDGSVVAWDQGPLPGGGEPERPAPTLTLSGSGADHDTHGVSAPAPTAAEGSHSDGTARWLAGGALVLGAVAVAVALVSRRSRRSP
jgi:uncharacterized protein YcnI